VLAKADGSGILKVKHYGEDVCRLDCRKLHEAPRRHMKGEWKAAKESQHSGTEAWDPNRFGGAPNLVLMNLLSDFAIVSREPIIREYDHEVQGNTILKPLAGASGDAPQDGSVIRVDGSKQLVALSLAMLPEWGKTDPLLTGRATVDECVRQLIAMGANPERIAILDNFCMGNPDELSELGALVETCKGMAKTAEAYGAPFVSGKDSFYNYFKTDDGPISIPVTLLVSGFGIVENPEHIVGASLRNAGSKLCIVGRVSNGLRGSVVARRCELSGECAPEFDEARSLSDYRKYHELVCQGLVLSAHDVGEGGLAVALAEMGFSGKAGISVDLKNPPASGATVGVAERLFGETPGRIVFEISAEHAGVAEAAGFVVIGETTSDGHLSIADGGSSLIHVPIAQLKPLWKDGLSRYY
jgi:phosphoribosylformylglycinamidine (FGAM) synthase-like enzyme